jgi:dihydrofolate reductase/effector-binding domain-containing protein
MRKLMMRMSMSIDGFVGGPNGENDWVFKSSDETSRSWAVEQFWKAGLIIMGRKSFEMLVPYWPTATGPFAAPMNEIPQAVFTKKGFAGIPPVAEQSPAATSWTGARVFDGDLAEGIRKLKDEPGKPIVSPQKFTTMNLEIINENLRLDIYGFSGIAMNKDYAGTAFKLMDKMWQTVKSNNLKTNGLNIWVYEQNEKIFAGVELSDILKHNTELEQKNITLTKYAYYKHIGSYNLIKQVGQNMRDEVKSKGFETILPYVEIYGHWTNDETKLETELLMSLK